MSDPHPGTGLFELPLVRLDPINELAAAARKCAMLRSVRRVAEWVEPERRITKTGKLTLSDARTVVRDLMLPGDQGPGRTAARRASDFEELDELWELAFGAELLDDYETVARPGPALTALRHDRDAEVAEVWLGLLATRLDDAMASPELTAALVPVLMTLYVTPDVVSTGDLSRVALGVVLDVDPEELDSDPRAAGLVEMVGDAVEVFVAQLVALDAAVDDAEGVALTPLGRYGVNGWVETIGVVAPAISDLAEASAADLIELGYSVHSAEEMDAAFGSWLAGRDPERAALELIEYAATAPDQQSRVAAVTIADRIGPPAEAAFRTALRSEVLGPHARLWLFGHGLDDTEPSADDLRWVLVEALAPLLSGDDEEIRAEMSAGTMAAAEQLDLVAGLWECTHPQTVEVLDALATHHPDPGVTRAARKALLQARTSRATAPRRTGKKAGSSGKPKSAKARAKAKTAAARAAFETSVCQLKITLDDVQPPIWRRVTVPATIDLAQLHAVVQTAMGWTDSHLHGFELDGWRYGDREWSPDLLSEDGVRLVDLVREGGRINYEYDFGDDWRHTIVLEKLIPGDAGAEVPACLAGRRACPPEDCGGPWGYGDFLAAYGDPKHPEHETIREWAGPNFDPEHLDLDRITRVLRRFLVAPTRPRGG